MPEGSLAMKVLLIDDHPLILSALQTVIQGLGDDVSVVGVGSARAAREALGADAQLRPRAARPAPRRRRRLRRAGRVPQRLPGAAGRRRVGVATAPATSSARSTSARWASCPSAPRNETLFEALHMVYVGRHLRAADDDGRRRRAGASCCRPRPAAARTTWPAAGCDATTALRRARPDAAPDRRARRCCCRASRTS